ncbi:gamma-glutamylcyclotransferase family protein [Nocardiopsis sediminis]|uniref:Gamma-glutamylcyclotransferase family protein n=1 Tax=Nocardiopsis sediminis TaxID=1778267 RepID=A0ABV8FQN7_9ACTN
MARVPLYAAYSANLDPDRMGARAPRSPLWSTGWLEGWRLTFGGGHARPGGALPTVVEHPGSSVFVAVYDVCEWDEPHVAGGDEAGSAAYTRIRVRVRTLLDGDATAWAHVLDDYEGGLPTPERLGRLADAAGKAGAPASYIADLLSRPTA